ncbi:MAG TPA: von Willebrand factor type A domain-containing protein [Pirellulales bacterium]|nr:von Willebrand factor type A domain-containing protein [Pirellulales bacterium]
MSAEFGSDPWLDARLRDVPLPPGMLARLEQIASTSDEELDEIVRNVPVPADLVSRVSRFPRPRRRRYPMLELAMAAAVLVAIGFGLSRIPVHPVERSTGDGAMIVQRAAGARHAGRPAAGASDPSSETSVAAATPEGRSKLPADDFHSGEVVDDAEISADRASLAAADHTLATDEDEAAGMSEDDSPSSASQHAGILTAPHGSDRLPPLETVSPRVDRGLSPPLVAGYDLLYQLKMGERPFVAPDAGPALASSPIPLVRDTISYELARDAIAAGHLPPADEVRIEDFLAAFDNLFPPTKDPMALHISAGPAPFGEPALQLLQVGLRAGGNRNPDPATGLPRVVGRNATLIVAFNPQVVQAYRLVGHATTTLTGPVASITKVDLTGGSEVAGLFELWLKPGGGDNVATVDLAWNDPTGTAQRHATGRVVRGQFVKTFAECAPSLQAAALAAETARSLRSHAAPGRGLAKVLDLSTQVSADLRAQPSFAELMQFVAQADKVRANPGAGARRAAADAQP